MQPVCPNNLTCIVHWLNYAICAGRSQIKMTRVLSVASRGLCLRRIVQHSVFYRVSTNSSGSADPNNKGHLRHYVAKILVFSGFYNFYGVDFVLKRTGRRANKVIYKSRKRLTQRTSSRGKTLGASFPLRPKMRPRSSKRFQRTAPEARLQL